MWSGRCPRYRCINYLIRAGLSHHIDRRGGGVDVHNGGSWRVPSPRVVVVVAVVVVGGGGLLGECEEHEEVSTPQRAFHTSASLNQGCKTSDWLYAKQSPSSRLRTLDDYLDRLLVKGPVVNLRGEGAPVADVLPERSVCAGPRNLSSPVISSPLKRPLNWG